MGIPHVIPYQGSKRKLAPQILKFIRHQVKGNVFEPFAGSAAITLAAATAEIGNGYIIGDKYSPLISLWDLIIDQPDLMSSRYQDIWQGQLENPKDYYIEIREQFNQDNDPVKFLYLVARCVKNAIRFNSNGKFNQSPDNRRLGMKPDKVFRESLAASSLLKNKAKLIAGDFTKILESANHNDLVYLDPPWQGTSHKKDSRYAYLLDLDDLIAGLSDLNDRNIPYLLSFDGVSGGKKYGEKLPDFLKLKKVELNAGRSSQATLLGRKDVTIESLYLSPSMIEKNEENFEKNEQLNLIT